MKFLRRTLRFLGGINFAVTLIAAVACLVIVGTLIEGRTDSHLQAAFWTYDSPVFTGLLWLFFVNILVSALRRWPFRWGHLPFLITHLGLLMILGGCLVKSYWGTQGAMGLLEGAVSDRIFLLNSEQIQIQKRDGESYAIRLKDLPQRLDHGLELELLGYAAHSREELQLWIKDKQAFIAGLPPFPVLDPNDEGPLPVSLHAYIDSKSRELWHLMAFRSHDPEALAQRAYVQGTEMHIRHAGISLPLETALKEPVALPNGTVTIELDWEQQRLVCDWQLPVPERSYVELRPTAHGRNVRIDYPQFGAPAYPIDLRRVPTILLIQDLYGDEQLHSFDTHGLIHQETFRKSQLSQLLVYDGAYQGYGISTSLPRSLSRLEAEAAEARLLEEQLRVGLESEELISPPLELLRQACRRQKKDFPHILSLYLEEWRQRGGWLFEREEQLSPELAEVLAELEWDSEPQLSRGVLWLSSLQGEVISRMQAGEDAFAVLKEMQWPLLHLLQTQAYENDAQLLMLFSQQLLSVSEQLPDPEESDLAQRPAHYLSAALRAYGIHSDNLLPDERPQAPGPALDLETRVTTKHTPLRPMAKLEDNIPLVALRLSDGEQSEVVELSYDPYGSGLKWPALNGRYLLRFQPEFQQLPYKLRLRDTRQINYAASGQAYSFESDVIIYERDNTRQLSLWERALQFCGILPERAPVLERCISMNQVHETWDGYRFYMANITPPQEVTAQRAQIVVNCDPGKYRLTYPGACLVALGIVLLWKGQRT